MTPIGAIWPVAPSARLLALPIALAAAAEAAVLALPVTAIWLLARAAAHTQHLTVHGDFVPEKADLSYIRAALAHAVPVGQRALWWSR